MTFNANQQNPANQVGGFQCPRCKAPIRFPIAALLTQPSICCEQCGLELFIDPEQSAAALKDLRRYVEGLGEAERILEDGQPGK